MLGYTGAKRSAIASNVPTIPKAASQVSMSCHGTAFLCPPRPRPSLTKMNADTIAALADPSVHGPIAARLREPPDAPRERRRISQGGSRNLDRVIKQASIGPEK